MHLNAPPPAPEGSDELVHFVAFAALVFPLARTGRIGLLHLFVGESAYGGVIELIQPSFNQSADVNDWIASIVRVVLGIGCGLRHRRLRRRYAYSSIDCDLNSLWEFRFSSQSKAH